MRTYGKYAALSPRAPLDVFHDVVRARNLVAARLDPGYSVRVDAEGILDLVFSDGERFVIVPYLCVQGMMLLIQEHGPLLWPNWLPRLRAGIEREIEEELDPWLRSLSVARCVNDETLKLFGSDVQAHDVVLQAREYGFLAAAPTEIALEALAPYAYAMRFACGKTVAIEDERGANGAALLARVASRVDVELGDRKRAELARRWFGLDIFDRSPDSDRYDVALYSGKRTRDATVSVALDDEPAGRVVEVAKPIPPSVMVSFDPGEGAAIRRFGVRAPSPALRPSGIAAMPVVGGSTGRIGLVVRDDFIGAGDADTDAANALAARLAEQGFSPAIVPANHVHARDYDLIHVFGLRCAPSLRAALERSGDCVVPIVVTPYADDPADEAEWGGAIGRAALENATDDLFRAYYWDAVGDRNLEAPTVPNRGTRPLAEEADVQWLVARAQAMIVTCDEESAAVRERFKFFGPARVAPALFAADESAGEIDGLVGCNDYVLAHAPIDARCNQFPLVEAVRELGYPIVLTGCVRDVFYYSESVAVSGNTAQWLPEERLSAAQIAALYRGARVFADVSWSAGGLYRLARAGASGAALVAPASGYAGGVWPGLVVAADPASRPSMAAAIKRAWEHAAQLGPAIAMRTAEACDPFESLCSVLSAYQAAAGPAAAGPARL